MPPPDRPMPGLLASVLDRLIDPDAVGTAAAPGYTVRQMELAVLRDLNDLLNTVCPHAVSAARFPEARDSVVAFGVPDLVSAEVASTQQLAAFGKHIKGSIERFEPRLRAVKVTLTTPEPDARMAVKFRVQARLAVDPAPEVAFDTIVDLNSGKCEVKPQVPG